VSPAALTGGGPPAMLLEVVGLESHYGRIRALAGIDLAVAEGELLALVGANGAGKTTLLRTISGVRPASAGRIRFAGEDVTRAPPSRRVALGIAQVPEGRQVFAPLSVEDNILLGGWTRRAGDLADDLERHYAAFPALREKRRDPAGTLSGGQQQMLAIARALMARPRLLLLDEPSMGLAPKLVEEIFRAIVALRGAGTTIFLVEQNAHAALAIADRGYVLETGSIVLQDTGRALLANERVRQAYLGI
jgi:branched-chain amino acid transport system ATP-binding protein